MVLNCDILVNQFEFQLIYYIPFQTSRKVKFRSPDGDTDYFNIVASVLQGDTLAPYLFIICQD